MVDNPLIAIGFSLVVLPNSPRLLVLYHTPHLQTGPTYSLHPRNPMTFSLTRRFATPPQNTAFNAKRLWLWVLQTA